MLCLSPIKKIFSILAEDSGETWFELNVPRAGTIVGLLLTQDDGSRDGFTLDIFDRESVQDGVPAALEGHYRVIAQKTAADNVVSVSDVTNHWHYTNMDGAGPADRQGRLYGRITFGGGSVSLADKNFTLSLTILPASTS